MRFNTAFLFFFSLRRPDCGKHRQHPCPNIGPRSLFDINAMPAVATDSNGNFTVTWGYMGLDICPASWPSAMIQTANLSTIPLLGQLRLRLNRSA